MHVWMKLRSVTNFGAKNINKHFIDLKIRLHDIIRLFPQSTIYT